MNGKTKQTNEDTQLQGPVEETKVHAQPQGRRETSNRDGALSNSAHRKTRNTSSLVDAKMLQLQKPTCDIRREKILE